MGIERPLWLDEAFCALAARQSAAGIVELLRTDNSMPLYYFLLAGWVRLFGDSEIAIRLLSGIFYLGGGVTAGLVGRRLANGCLRASGYAAMFYLCSLQAIHQAQNVRMYSLLGLLAGLSLLAYLRLFFDADRPRAWWLFYFLINTIGVMSQHWFVFVLFAQFWGLVLWNRRALVRFILLGLAAAVPFLTLWAPILRDQMSNGSSKWIPAFRAWFISDAFTRFYGGAPALFLFGFAAVILVKADPAIRRGILHRRPVQLAALVFLLSVAVPLVVSVFRPLYWPDRYTIIALVPLAALLGVLFAEAAPRPVALSIAVLFLSFHVWLQFATRDSVTFGEIPDGLTDRVTAKHIAEHGRPGDAILFTSLNRAAADYYLHRLGAEGRFAEFSYPSEFAHHLGWESDQELLARPGWLEKEAAELATRLRQLKGHRVWLYHRDAYPPGEILRRSLAATLTLEREQPAHGPFHNRLLVYRVP
ncbi:MAG: glycosyltransferase family 39 protein [Acidobacteria bacterium]|nr:glycosyltransferase family 39 protein [Acidobacteriota bacterium]